MFEEEFTEEEIQQEMLYVIGLAPPKGLTQKEIIDKVIENLERKHLQIHLDVMAKEGLLNTNKKGEYSLTDKALKINKEGKISEYTKEYSKKYNSDGTLKNARRK